MALGLFDTFVSDSGGDKMAIMDGFSFLRAGTVWDRSVRSPKRENMEFLKMRKTVDGSKITHANERNCPHPPAPPSKQLVVIITSINHEPLRNEL